MFKLAEVSYDVTYLSLRYLAIAFVLTFANGSVRFPRYVPPRATLGLRAIPHTPGFPFSPDPRLILMNPFSPQLSPHEFLAIQ